MDGRASRAVADMDPAKKNHLHKELTRKFSRANGSKVGCFIPVNRKTRRENMKIVDAQGDAHKPRVLQPSLMGVQIYDDTQHFFSRQSSTASMDSEKSRSGVVIPCFSGNEQGDALKAKRGLSNASLADAGKWEQSGRRSSDSSRSRLDGLPKTTSFEKARAASGVLYPPSPRTGGNANSSILNAVHFSFGDASATESGHVTDKIYKQLLDQARLQNCIHSKGGEMKRNSSRTAQRSSSSVAKQSPRSTLVRSSASLTFSERLFGYEFSKESFRRLSEQQQQQQPDAKSAQASVGRTTLTPQLDADSQAHNSVSILAVSNYEDTDDDDIIIEGDIIFEIPGKTPLRCSHGKQHYADLVMVRTKPRPSSGRWSSNKKSFHLNLKRQPSIDGSSRRQHRSAPTADPERRDVTAREKLDVSHHDISSRSSSDAGSKRGTQLSSASGRSGWFELESDMDDFVLDSGRLKIDVPFEPDMEKPFAKQGSSRLQSRDGAKMDEGYFPFNSPTASSFLFEEPGGKKRSEDAAQPAVKTTSRAAMAKTVFVGTDCDGEELDLSEDAFHDPEEGSISDTDSSLTTFSLEEEEAESMQGQMDLQHSQWIATTTSFNYLREVVDHNSGFMNIESRSGRFSVDLRQGKRLKKVEHHPHTLSRPGVRVSLRRSSQSKQPTSSRRSLLAPCLVCLSCIHQRPAQVEQR